MFKKEFEKIPLRIVKFKSTLDITIVFKTIRYIRVYTLLQISYQKTRRHIITSLTRAL